jgi:hypothetical protein
MNYREVGGVKSLEGEEILPRSVQTGYGSHSASSVAHSEDCFPGLRMSGAVFPFPIRHHIMVLN